MGACKKRLEMSEGTFDVEETEDGHLLVGVLARPHPHDGVEKRLREEGNAWYFSAVLLIHSNAEEAYDGV